MREIHGVADAQQQFVGGPVEVAVTVTDGRNGEVTITVNGKYADLSPDQAEHIAEMLIASSSRMRMRTTAAPARRKP